MRYLIVNGDDLGMHPGISRGIFEAHVQGIVTSTSAMVDMPDCPRAAVECRRHPGLSVGLHVQLTTEAFEELVDFDDPGPILSAIERQYARFEALFGHCPTHLDSHHNVHLDPRLEPTFVDFARRHRLPLRGHSPARYFSSFYGNWDGEAHPEHISVDNLIVLMQDEVGAGITELGCHPGRIEPDFVSGYALEREVEVATLCDPRLRAHLAEVGIVLASFHDLWRLAGDPR